MVTGNEKFMENVQITSNYLYGVNVSTEGTNVILDSDSKEPLTFIANDPTECEEECRLRCGVCGAWSYNIKDAMCFLHTADACCSQHNNRHENIDFVSGFFCTKCW